MSTQGTRPVIITDKQSKMELLAMAARKYDTKSGLVLKPLRGRIDYTIFNYCAGCMYKLPKELMRCPDCNQKVRTRPWHRSALVDSKRV